MGLLISTLVMRKSNEETHEHKETGKYKETGKCKKTSKRL